MMKIVFSLLFVCLVVLAEMILAHYHTGNVNSGHFSTIEASLDKNIMYVVVTASILGVVKLKRNAS